MWNIPLHPVKMSYCDWFDKKKMKWPIFRKEVYLGLLNREFSRKKKDRVDSQMESKQYKEYRIKVTELYKRL